MLAAGVTMCAPTVKGALEPGQKRSGQLKHERPRLQQCPGDPRQPRVDEYGGLQWRGSLQVHCQDASSSPASRCGALRSRPRLERGQHRCPRLLCEGGGQSRSERAVPGPAIFHPPHMPPPRTASRASPPQPALLPGLQTHSGNTPTHRLRPMQLCARS